MKDKARRRWQLLIQCLVIGYSVLGRSFAYIGLAPAKLFIGEIVMGWFFATRVRATERVIFWANRSRATQLLRLAVGIFLLYGVVCIVHGYVLRRPAMPTLMNFAFNYYALYMIIAVAASLGSPSILPVLGRRLAWIHGIYGVLYIAGLQHMWWIAIPGTNVGVFAQPNGSAFAVLAMLSYETRTRRAIIPILLNLAVMAAVQVRAEWLGFMAAFAVWSVLAGRIRRFLVLTSVAIVLVIVGLVFDVRLPGLSGRGGEVSVKGIVGRMLSSFDPDAAYHLVEEAEAFGGTVDWRKRWWRGIWDSVHETDKQFFIGHGYGFDLTSLTENVEEGVRTPHNVFFYALAYGGWIGALIFAFMQFALGLCLWRAYRITHDAFGLSYWVLGLTLGLLGNSFETPFGAIPFYLTIGLVIAPLFQVPAPAPPRPRPATPALLPTREQLPWLVDTVRGR